MFLPFCFKNISGTTECKLSNESLNLGEISFSVVMMVFVVMIVVVVLVVIDFCLFITCLASWCFGFAVGFVLFFGVFFFFWGGVRFHNLFEECTSNANTTNEDSIPVLIVHGSKIEHTKDTDFACHQQPSTEQRSRQTKIQVGVNSANKHGGY